MIANDELSRRAWYPVAAATTAGWPRQAFLFGTPVVVFYTGGEFHVLEDRCPHRGVELSGGRIVADVLECPYHGWRFRGDGSCAAVPALPHTKLQRIPCVRRFPIRVEAGLVFTSFDGEPKSEPQILLADDTYHEERLIFDFDAALADVAENALDVPHTAFLHRGLFRSAQRLHRIEARVRTEKGKIEAEFLGESPPSGLIARLLGARGGTLRHWDRFFFPGVTQVEYRSGDAHLILQGYLAPLSATRTRMFAIARIKTRVPLAIAAPLLMPFVRKLLRQDADILASQARTRVAFPDRTQHSQAADLMGNQILKLLRNDGEIPANEHRCEMFV